MAMGQDFGGMKKDALRQFVALKSQLLREKAALEGRLREIEAALGSIPNAVPAPAKPRTVAPVPSRGRKRKSVGHRTAKGPGEGKKPSLRDAFLEIGRAHV